MDSSDKPTCYRVIASWDGEELLCRDMELNSQQMATFAEHLLSRGGADRVEFLQFNLSLVGEDAWGAHVVKTFSKKEQTN